MPDDYQITEAMVRYGGSFVKALGHLYRTADAENRATLKAAYPELWDEYKNIVELHAQREAKP